MAETQPAERSYDPIAARLRGTGLHAAPRERLMQAVADELWLALEDRGVSWVGFYVPAADSESLELGPHRDKPACTPIGMHGVCGQAFLAGRVRVVEDVTTLGDRYVACDPRDRSEVVVPLFEPDGRVWGVLDLDSHDLAAFNASDIEGLKRVLAAAFGETAVSPDA